MSKILGSKYENFIRKELLTGTSSRALSEKLKELGFEISHNAINQFHKSHLDGEVNKSKAVQETPINKPINLTSAKNIDTLKESYKIALQISQQRLKEHADGECKFPTEELKGLKIIDDLMKSNDIARNA